MSPAAVVTGIGVIAPTGLDAGAHWASIVGRRSGIRRITRFDPGRYDSRLAGEVDGFTPSAYLPGRLLPQTDHMTRMSLAAADMALRDARVGADDLAGFGVGVVTASTAGGFEFGQNELQKLWSKGPEHVSAYQSFAWFYAVNTGQISIRHGARGPSGVLVTDQAGGLDAVGQARRHIRGDQPMMITGGVDGSLCPWGWVAHLADGTMSNREDPDRAFLPFDEEANGHVPGEGGALLVVESKESATARGQTSWYGEITGYAATFDPPPESGEPPNLGRAAELALADAGIGAADVDVVFADAAGTPSADAAEAAALRRLFGPYGVPVCAPKTMTGRLGAGGAALDIASALLSIRHSLLPPAVNVTRPAAAHEIDLVREPRAARIRHALVLARGRHGFNAALVLAAPGDG
jgi:act minimal PKS chain-length factor (CLF/KS beta)